MLCERCNNNEATVKLEHNFNGDKKSAHLCEDCSAEVEMHMLIGNIFNDILGSTNKKQNMRKHAQPTIKCKTCGLTFSELKKDAVFGCATCYESFSVILKELLMGAHGALTHEGKIPRRMGETIKREKHVSTLRLYMKQAVQEEDFSRAAFLRDQIRRLEKDVTI